jgi:hypothetical protein
VLPGTAPGAVLPGTAPGAAPRTVVETVCEGEAAAVAAVGASGRVSAAAQVTPIEEARYPRMPSILDIVIHICPSRT